MKILAARGMRGVLALAGVALLGLVLRMGAVPQSNAAPAPCDVVILHGRVMDPESGLDAVRNIGIRDGKIAAISEQPLAGNETIEAKGLVLAPGFIDLHQHGQDAENNAAKIADGVTTSLELEVGTADVDKWYKEHEGKSAVNFGVSVGHIPVRSLVMKDPGKFLPSGDAAHRVATAEELVAIEQGIERGLRQGAVAVGAGPAYTQAATNWELIEVFKIAAQHHASVHIHIRTKQPNADGDIAGFEEAIAAAMASGAPLHIVHLQSTGGPNVPHELEMIQALQQRGMDITTECYPYNRGMTSIASALYDGNENEPDSFFAAILYVPTGEYLTREKFFKYRKEGGLVIAPSNTEENVHAAVVSPLTMIASDGNLENGKGHPRTIASYSKVLSQYVREEKALDLMTALRKMTLMPAQRLEKRAPVFKNKGRIKVGADADITIFDAARIKDRATYAQPTLPNEGIEFVLVNGTPVLRDGKILPNVLPGKPVRAPLE